jgi:hypothetical protein
VICGFLQCAICADFNLHTGRRSKLCKKTQYGTDIAKQSKEWLRF